MNSQGFADGPEPYGSDSFAISSSGFTSGETAAASFQMTTDPNQEGLFNHSSEEQIDLGLPQLSAKLRVFLPSRNRFLIPDLLS